MYRYFLWKLWPDKTLLMCLKTELDNQTCTCDMIIPSSSPSRLKSTISSVTFFIVLNTEHQDLFCICNQHRLFSQLFYLKTTFPVKDREDSLIAASLYATDIDWLHSSCTRRPCFPPKTGRIVWSQLLYMAKILSERRQDIDHQARNFNCLNLFS